MFGGGGPGGFLNLGAPEVIVIGAVAWAILGPKELFRLSREAGKFLGEWQQLGQQAKDQFQAALETEMAEEESASAAAASAAAGTAGAYSSNRQYPDDMSPSQAADIAPIGASGSNTDTGQTSGLDASSIPSLSEYSAQRDVGSTQSGTAISYEETEQLRASLYADLGEPTANDANFQNQISGARNEAGEGICPRARSIQNRGVCTNIFRPVYSSPRVSSRAQHSSRWITNGRSIISRDVVANRD